MSIVRDLFMNRRSFFLGAAPALLVAQPALATAVCSLNAAVAPSIPPLPKITNMPPTPYCGDVLFDGGEPAALETARSTFAAFVRAMEVLSAGRDGWELDMCSNWRSEMGGIQGGGGVTVRASVLDYANGPFPTLGGPRQFRRNIVPLSDVMGRI